MTKANRCKGSKNSSNRKGKVRLSASETLLLTSFIASLSSYNVNSVTIEGNRVTYKLESRTASATCPHCGTPSVHLFGFTDKTLTALPGGSCHVRVMVRQHRYRCMCEGCKARTFTEPSEAFALYGRRTHTCDDLICACCLKMSSVSCSELVGTMGIEACPNTCTSSLFRRLGSPPSRSGVKVVGIDDFAKRKGHSYGTVIVDQEAGVPLELVDSRDMAEVAARLLLYPDLEEVTRDRGKCYIAAIRELNRLIAEQNAATGGKRPFVRDIADKFHVMENLSDAGYPDLQKEFAAFIREAAEAGAEAKSPGRDDGWVLGAIREFARRKAGAAANRKQAEWEKVTAMHAKEGMKIGDIAKATGMSSKKVRKYTQASQRDYMPKSQHYLLRNAEHITSAVHDLRGFDAKGIVRMVPNGKANAGLLRELSEFLGAKLEKMKEKAVKSGCSHEAVKKECAELWQTIFKHGHEVKSEVVDSFCQKEHVAVARYLCSTFQGILAGEISMPLHRWIDTAVAIGNKSIASFALGVRKDYDAINNAITSKWNNGRLEGTVCKIKCIKRIMYGRASLRLLGIKCTKGVHLNI